MLIYIPFFYKILKPINNIKIKGNNMSIPGIPEYLRPLTIMPEGYQPYNNPRPIKPSDQNSRKVTNPFLKTLISVINFITKLRNITNFITKPRNIKKFFVESSLKEFLRSYLINISKIFCPYTA